MDAAIIALVSSIAVAAIGGTVAVVTTIINSRTERAKSAKVAMHELQQKELDVKDERIALRDEQLADCEADKASLGRKLDWYRARVRELEQGQ